MTATSGSSGIRGLTGPSSQGGEQPGSDRAPVVGIVAPRALARKLVAVLRRDGLAVAGAGDRRRRDLDALVIAVESPADARDAIRDARNDYPSARLVLVVDTATPAEARHMLIDDVPGLVIAKQADATLALAVRAARAGHISYPAELMPNRMRGALSKREKQILGMVVMGFSNAEIAAKLHISESTVKSHLSSAFAILGVRSRKEAAALILDPNAGFGTGILAITDSG